eukprot:RCo055406
MNRVLSSIRGVAQRAQVRCVGTSQSQMQLRYRVVVSSDTAAMGVVPVRAWLTPEGRVNRGSLVFQFASKDASGRSEWAHAMSFEAFAFDLSRILANINSMKSTRIERDALVLNENVKQVLEVEMQSTGQGVLFQLTRGWECIGVALTPGQIVLLQSLFRYAIPRLSAMDAQLDSSNRPHRMDIVRKS